MQTEQEQNIPPDPFPVPTYAPLPQLTGDSRAPDGKPQIVRSVEFLNMAAFALSLFPMLGGLCAFTGGSWDSFFAGLVLMAPAGILLTQMILLHRRKQAAWGLQCGLTMPHFVWRMSILGLFFLPIGTILNVLVLGRWFDPATKEWFGIPDGLAR